MNSIHRLGVGRLPPLAAIRVFEAAARYENFTQAANELGLTQSAVSHQIRVLEERLGLALFDRSGRGVKLTDSGRRLGPAVATAFRSLEESFSSLMHEEGRLLTVSTSPVFGTTWLAPRLGEFQIQHQQFGVRLDIDRGLVDFATGEFDAAVRLGHGPWPGLRHHFLFRVHYTPVCSPDFAARHRLRNPEQLLALPRLRPSAEWWGDWFAEIGITLRGEGEYPNLELDNQTTEASAALAGAGVAMLTPMLWRTDLSSGRLVQLFDHVHVSSKSHWLVYPDSKRAQAKVRAFREWMIQSIRHAEAGELPEVFEPWSAAAGVREEAAV